MFPGHTRFTRSIFSGYADFEDATFKGVAHFEWAAFKAVAQFEDATFGGFAHFECATFDGQAQFLDAIFWDAFFEDATFGGNVCFTRSTFHGVATFHDATFSGAARFDVKMFDGDADFEHATFSGDADFEAARFNERAMFEGATFEALARFSRVHFCGPTSFRSTRFKAAFDTSRVAFRNVPDFRQTSFGAHVTLRSFEIEQDREFDDEDADRLRRLKELAIGARDHELEQQYFALEMRAARHHEFPRDFPWDPPFRLLPMALYWFRLVPNYLYDWISNFGRSLIRPAGGLIATWFGSAFAYTLTATQPDAGAGDGFVYSGTLLFPFLGFARHAGELARKALFGEDLPTWISALGFIEGLLGLIFLFLIGLALRNRFRL